ncbi:MAG: immune inhibitor A [Anaerolineae bacterium]|nr:immune inhibitor A [Anaerolineae bacterium]
MLILICTIGVIVGAWVILPALNNPAVIGSMANNGQPVTPTPVPVIDREPIATSTPTMPTATPTSSATAPVDPTAPTSIDTPSPTPVERVIGQAAPLQPSTEQLLTQTDLPERDQRLLAMRLKAIDEEIPEVTAKTKHAYQVGDTETLWVTDNFATPPRNFEVTASLQFMTDHAYWWVQQGFNVVTGDLQRSAEQFETQTYPTNREFFGSEWTPGIDNDERVHIFMGDVPGVAGYFSASNSYSHLAEPYSNEREMFFINASSVSPGNDYFDSVLAHEFQHMIHWHQDRNEDTWVNEGLSELASFLNGYGPSSFVGSYTGIPDTQLNSWTSSPADYGAGFLFMAYFLQRYGEEMTKAVVAHPQNGIAGFNVVLAEHNRPEKFTDIFADFLVANYLDDPDLDDGRYGYDDFSLSPIVPEARYGMYPVEQQTTVYQFGGDYIELTGQGDVTGEFTGSTRVKVVNNDAHSGQYQWYSHRGDDTNTRLTHAFDLSQVDAATLNYWTWYDLEANWDFGYVEVSTDGGQKWTILPTSNSTTANPSGNAFGPGYTGLSGNGPTWLEESIDLTPYAGQEILVRFEYVADDAVNRPGWTIDDISIPEIGFFDDVEHGTDDWQAEGFVRIDNVLPQPFVLQLIEIGETGVEVRRIPLDDTNYGTFTVEGLGSNIQKAVMIVSGAAPVTTEPASYQYQFTIQ